MATPWNRERFQRQALGAIIPACPGRGCARREWQYETAMTGPTTSALV